MTPAVLDRRMLRGPASAQLRLGEQRPGRAVPASPANAGLSARAATATARSEASTARAATVADLIAGTWRGLSTHQAMTCPLCSGQMLPRYGAAGVAPVGGRCGDCGTTLG